MLVCPVRDCRLPLVRDAKRAVCAAGHSFDTARSGYLNLLQPQDRKSKEPGDSRTAVAARRRLHDQGVTAPLLEAITSLARPSATDRVLDAGCGDGFYLGSLAAAAGCAGCGIDLSVPAIEAAARRYPNCEWIVANADRFIPCAEASFSLVLSITARMNPPEFRRVLRHGGRLLVAIPAPDDLIELRGQGRDRVARTVETFTAGTTPPFRLLEQRRVTTTADLDETGVEDVLAAIYRPLRSTPVSSMRVTFSLDLLLFD